MSTFEEDLAKAVAYHGHLCAGMVHGVRMARLACQYLGIADPRSNRDLMVFVEMARCPADAVYAVTGITVGRRRLKIIDYGKAAITMLDLANGRAVRLCPASRAPSCPKGQDPVEFFAAYRDEELYEVQQVHVEVAPQDMPGRPSVRAVCERCGERVLDGREVVVDGVTLCRPCADGAYYELLAPPVGGPR